MSTNFSSNTVAQNDPANLPNAVQAQLNSATGRNQARHNSALPNDSWRDIDDTVYETFDRELRIVNDLRGQGLTTGVSVYAQTSEWNVTSDEATATVAMDPETATPEGSVSYDLRGVPVPVIMADFSTGFREQGIPGRRPGNSVDTIGTDSAAREVAWAMEDLVINGWGPTINPGDSNNAYSLYGLATHPDREPMGLTDWTNDKTVVRSEIRDMINFLSDEQNMTPGGEGYWLYLASDLYNQLDDVDPEGSGDMLIRERVENLSDLGAIRQTDALNSGEAVMFRPTSDVIDLAIATDEDGERIMGTTVQWQGPGGFRDHYKTMSIAAPRVKSTKTGQCGIVHASV